MLLKLTTCVVAAAFVLVPGPNTATAEPHLAGQNASELERLLAVPAQNRPAIFSHRHPPRIPADALDRYLMWNEIALDTTAIDHTPADLAQGEDPRRFGAQLGPHRSSYAMAIVHIAMFEAINAITRKYESYVDLASVRRHVSMDRAIAQAARDSLVALFPFQAVRIDALLAEDIAKIQGSTDAIEAGKKLGAAAAHTILTSRENDGSDYPEPRVGVDFFSSNDPGKWQPDPVSGLKVALGGNWPKVKPFVLKSARQFRPVPPPQMTDAAYTNAYDEVKRVGGDPTHGTGTNRTEQQTFSAVLWAYDGTPSLCAPPRLYNQILRTIALKNGMTNVADLARLFALVNMAMADAGIAAWEAKYHYQFWRPVTGIRTADTDNNSTTRKDTDWYPLGGPATNTRGPNFTPPFPAYPSGHATFGGALFQILRKFWPDDTKFSFVSDEFNGINLDLTGTPRPLRQVSFDSFSAAEFDNAKSRIYMGVHWQFDADAGVKLGNEIADYVYDHAFLPVKNAKER
jgi:membrane-associated phospholipid phosphatase